MQAMGSMSLAWAQGYNGEQIQFINTDTFSFQCGNCIKFISDGGVESVFAPEGQGIGAFAVHSINKVFAIADTCIKPNISVYEYPSYSVLAVLEGGAALEYHSMVFSTSEFFATVTGVPDHKLIIWHYPSNMMLCSYELSHLPPTCLTFNPGNWRQLCLSSDTELSVWTIEQRDTVYNIQIEKLQLPIMTSHVGEQVGSKQLPPQERDIASRSTSRPSTAPLPVEAVAGLHGDCIGLFWQYQDMRPRVVPVTHCWTPSGDVLVGCSGGQLLRVDGEQLFVKMLVNPYRHSLKRPSSAKSVASVDFVDEGGRPLSALSSVDQSSSGSSNHLGSGNMEVLALHKRGLFAGGQDGTLRHLEILPGDVVHLLNTYTVTSSPISTLAFNAPHHSMAIGSQQGMIFTATPENPGDLKLVCDVHSGPVIAVDMLAPGTQLVVSVRQDGEVQLWDMDTGKLVSALPVCYHATCMVASPLTHVIVVGTTAGFLFFVDLNKLDSPRIIERIHLHHGPVKNIAYGQNGHFLVSSGDDGFVYVLDGRVSNMFTILGCVEFGGDTMGVACHFNTEAKVTKVVVTSNTSGVKGAAANRIMHFNLPEDLPDHLDQYHDGVKSDLRDDAIKKVTFNLFNPSYGLTCTANNIAFMLADSSKKLHKLRLPEQPPKKDTSKDSYLKPIEDGDAHQLSGGKLRISPHHKWLASYAPDGQLIIRMIANQDGVTMDVNAHSYRTGGVADAAFSADCSSMFTVGFDGTIACFKWTFSSQGEAKAKIAAEDARARYTTMIAEIKSENKAAMALEEWLHPFPPSRPSSGTEKSDREKLEKERRIVEAIEHDNIFTTPTPSAGSDATWLEARKLEAHLEEDKKYAGTKKDLRIEIREMRRQLQGMIRENDEVPDIEQLMRHEFDLDIEEQRRLQSDGDAEVARIREEKDFENLAKRYLAHLIKKDCWTGMEVKGRGLVLLKSCDNHDLFAFSTPLEVQNYPLLPRPREEIEKFQRVETRRRVEIAERAAREIYAELDRKGSTNTADDDGIEALEDVTKVAKEKAPTTGSLGAIFGGACDLLYNQFERHTREEKMMHVVLLENTIYRIKKTFNKEFDKVYEKKVQEIAKIHDKNKRIRKILHDLDLKMDIFEPVMSAIEKPEMLLSVNDNEVKVEKFLSPEQLKRREEERLEDEERRAREKGNNWRDRGLDCMMGGVLEIKKEDELKKDISVPTFMTAKPDTEWSEDEKKAAVDYERKVKDLNEERDKYRKQLDMELKKLQGFINDGTDLFDEALKILFQRKIKMEMVVYQEELMILCIKFSLLEEEEQDNRDLQLNTMMEHKKQMKEAALEAMVVSRQHVEEYRELYDKLCAEDKVMDRGFKREFSDVPAHYVDQLYKIFRRRPRGQKARGTETPIYDPTSGNPFFERPSSARQRDQVNRGVELALIDLDKNTNQLEGVDANVWNRMCVLRREKIDSEMQVKTKALVLAGMQDYLQKRQDDDEHLRIDIDNLVDDLNWMKDERSRFTCNLQVQLLLKQGQVEVDPTNFIPDYTQSLLVHRSVVEELNGRIRRLGEKKISSMMESKDFRKGIVQLEWEHKRMTMQMEDLQNKMRDIQTLKVTREIQSYLAEADHDGKRAKDIHILEQTLVVMQEHHEKHLGEKKKRLKDIKKSIRDHGDENSALAGQLEDLNVSVNERRHIHEVNEETRISNSGQEQRYREIVQRRKLVDLAKAQAQEVAVLRAEVERLRMRTFPALVQVEH